MQLASTHNAYLFLNRKVTLAGKLVSSPRPSLWPGFEVLISLFITHCNLCVGGAAKHSCPDVDLESAVEKKKESVQLQEFQESLTRKMRVSMMLIKLCFSL